ncbi:MAG: dihydropyrimidinase [Beijerinckiaceae bacterium]
MQPFDLVIAGGTIATAVDVMLADIGIRDGRIAAIGRDLGAAKRVIGAKGRLVLPGGVDSHAHIEQLSAAGIMNADTFESATRAAALGGTTTVISFAAQHVGIRLRKVVDDYALLAGKGAIIDHCFHMIVADPTEEALETDLPALVREGHASIKLFMTYDKLKVDDDKLIDVLARARELKAMICVHAENHGLIAWMSKKLIARGYTAPKYHAVSHPRLSEIEAFQRLIAIAEFLDQPIMIFHVSTAEGAALIRQAQGRGVKVFAETCPQYLFLTAKDLDKPGTHGAKWMCSPPPRTIADQDALWAALLRRDLQVVSSDHAPYAYDATGKLSAGPDATFKQMANGLPGLTQRLPLLFDALVSKGRGTLQDFVALNCTEPAKIYGLHPRKGSLAIGGDADICIWDTKKTVTLADADVADNTRYTPYSGRRVKGWPVLVIRRGEIIVEDGVCNAAPGSGAFLPRKAGAAAEPTGRRQPEWIPALNFGAKLT